MADEDCGAGTVGEPEYRSDRNDVTSRARFSATERLGVNAIEKIFLNDFKWIPRVQHESDMGIDSQVEVSVHGEPKGRLLAIQIKTGSSYFKETKDDAIIYRGKKVHYEYWTKHSLPVLLVLHNPETGLTIWQHINDKTVVVLENSWKTEIPISQELKSNCASQIARISDGPENIQRLRRLQLERPLISRLANGERLVLEFQNWLHKSLKRTPLIISLQSEEGEVEVWNSYVSYVGSLEEMLAHVFPWANVEIDEEFYRENFDEPAVLGMYPIREKWHKIYPYTIQCMEMSSYRVVLSINDLGRSFLKLDDYLEKGPNL